MPPAARIHTRQWVRSRRLGAPVVAASAGAIGVGGIGLGASEFGATGYWATHTGHRGRPASFTLNGVLCAVA